MLGSNNEEKIINIYNSGIELHISMNLCKYKSVRPAKYPCIAPKKIPMITPINVRMKAKITDNLNPYINLANTSLPLSSVPR